jgi:hypothetical protein
MKGVVAVFVCKAGHVIGTAANFDKGKYGGFNLADSQKIRAKQELVGKVIRAYCSPNLTDNIQEYTYQRIFDDLINNGAKIHYEYIGHEES